MLRVLVRRVQCGLAFVHGFSLGAPVMRWYLIPVKVLCLAAGECGPRYLEIQVVADVSIKVTVARVARITFMPLQHLYGRRMIAAENGQTVRRQDWREDAEERFWLRFEQSRGYP